MIEQYLLIGLAAWRLTSLLSSEAGPFDVFQRIREMFGVTHDDGGVVFGVPQTFMAMLITCPWCLGVWMAAGCWILWEVEPVIVGVFAASSIVVIVEAWNRRV